MQSLFRHAACITLLILFLSQGTQGQNLVPNPSFEDINTCAEFAQPCSASAWFALSRLLTTGYYPRYKSAAGTRYVQMIAATRASTNRQYWETMLLCPLQPGERYAVSMKIASPANQEELAKTRPNLRDIGLWFTNRFIHVNGDSVLQPRSYLSFTDASTKDLKNGWFEIRKEFTAANNATIMIVGNFIRTANADIMDQRNTTNPSIDILVDDISVTRTNANAPLCPTAQKVKDSLYAILWRHSENYPPNPEVTTNANTPTAPNPTNPASQPNPANPSSKNPDTAHVDTASLRRPHPGNPADSTRTPSPKKSNPKTSNPTTPNPATSNPHLRTDTIVIRDIHFDFDKYLIQNPDTLQRYRSLLTRPGVKKIQVVGFTDDAGSAAYNLDLSQKRAHEIARLLSSKFNIAPSLIEAEGRGISKKYPQKSLNRRVEIYIFHE